VTGEWTRPGPETVEPGLAPGGVVIHVWGTDGPRLVHTVKLRTREQADLLGPGDAEFINSLMHDGEGVCLVIYDGDSGERMAPWGPGEMVGDVDGFVVVGPDGVSQRFR